MFLYLEAPALVSFVDWQPSELAAILAIVTHGDWEGIASALCPRLLSTPWRKVVMDTLPEDPNDLKGMDAKDFEEKVEAQTRNHMRGCLVCTGAFRLNLDSALKQQIDRMMVAILKTHVDQHLTTLLYQNREHIPRA